MINSNKISGIKIIVEKLLKDIDTLGSIEVAPHTLWEELFTDTDMIRQMLDSLRVEQEAESNHKAEDIIADDSDICEPECTLEEPEWMLDEPGPYVGDLYEAITLNDKICFVNELFDGDEKQYHIAIQMLNDLNSLERALIYTRETFPSWDENSTELYRFYMILRRRYDG